MPETQTTSSSSPRGSGKSKFFKDSKSSRRRNRPGPFYRWLEKLPEHLIARKINIYQVIFLVVMAYVAHQVIMRMMAE